MTEATFDTDEAGNVSIAIGTVVLTEEEFRSIARAFDKFLVPTMEARRKAAHEAERAELAAKCKAAQRFETFGGFSFVIQAHYEYGHDVRAWLSGFEDDDAPFAIQVDSMKSARPWTIELARGTKQWGNRRAQYVSDRGAVVRFASIEAAAKKALAMGLDVPREEKPPVG